MGICKYCGCDAGWLSNRCSDCRKEISHQRTMKMKYEREGGLSDPPEPEKKYGEDYYGNYDPS